MLKMQVSDVNQLGGSSLDRQYSVVCRLAGVISISNFIVANK